MSECTCGRDYPHCRICGRKNPYPKQKESMRISFELGQRVTVRHCQTCANDTHELMECKAPPLITEVPWTPGAPRKKAETKSYDNRPQFTLTPGSEEYLEAHRIRWDELASNPKLRGNLNTKDAMLKEGWVFEFGPNEEIKEEPAPIEEHTTELTLEQVIERMKEEQK